MTFRQELEKWINEFSKMYGLDNETAYSMAGKAFISANRCERHCYPNFLKPYFDTDLKHRTTSLIQCKDARWAIEQILVVEVKEDLIDFIIRKKIFIDPKMYPMLNRYVQTRRSTC